MSLSETISCFYIGDGIVDICIIVQLSHNVVDSFGKIFIVNQRMDKTIAVFDFLRDKF